MKKLLLSISLLLASAGTLSASTQVNTDVKTVTLLNPTTAEIIYTSGERMTVDFYSDNIFRLFQDNHGGILRAPEANPPAQILVSNARKNIKPLSIATQNEAFTISTNRVSVRVDKQTGLLKVTDLAKNNIVMEQTAPVDFKHSKYIMTLKGKPNEYFYGGGVQNGRFSHRGQQIEIVNTNSWTDGGVASPAPFYWSTGGYGVMCYTFAPGLYDFGSKKKDEVSISHDANYLDLFVMVDDKPTALLDDYYQLTGYPVLLPKFAFYEGHLNAYNRDFWKETTDKKKGILFEDGKYYTESQKDNGGIKESLNGELNNYQFSARAVIDRYKKYDMPLGWILPNDGYGAGYGQTETLDGNIANLRQFGDYAHKNGVEIGLWTQSQLHPDPKVSALLQRDIVKEVRDAGVRVLKTDVAWVGDGYSFGLNGVTDVGQIMPYYGNNARPFIITLDGWAGTQRYAGVWSGDQTGGKWEYIRFHIPTYIGAGLSGMPNITSDMDGIFGGKDLAVNVRDFQWKTFTPMQLNMDGWGSNPKYPQALGDTAIALNRYYLKLKSALLPYTYTISHEAVTGKPIMRAMFLDDENAFTLGSMTQYQYMYGPSLLVAPIYQATKADKEGNDMRNGIYLPKGKWIDYFTGDVYEGGKLLNNFDAPLWKLPVFVKAGAIIPMTMTSNNPSEIDKQLRIISLYPEGKTSFTLYDDDGTTEAYRHGEGATTLIESQLSGKGELKVTVNPTKGEFKGQQKDKQTIFVVNLTAEPKAVKAFIGKDGKQTVKLQAVHSKADFDAAKNAYWMNEAPTLADFGLKDDALAKHTKGRNPQMWVKIESVNTADNTVALLMKGYTYDRPNLLAQKTGALQAPVDVAVTEANTTAYTLTPTWKAVPNADYYEVEYDGMIYSTIREPQLLFSDLKPLTQYNFKVRAVNKDGVSDWTAFQATTKSNPLEFAIHGLTGKTSSGTSAEDHEVSRLFDFSDKGDIWFDYMDKNGKPFELVIDLHSTNTLDKLQYLPRDGGISGRFLKGNVSVSADEKTWSEPIAFNWANDEKTKEIVFANNPEVRYVKFVINEAVNKYLSGREIYVFKVPGTKAYIPGDLNQDGKIDSNDLTSYLNYTGLRKGDSDFEGYISKGDLNSNGLIDAQDISEVATKLDGGARASSEKVDGSVSIAFDKATYSTDDDVKIVVSGKDLKAVNAIGLNFPYNEAELKFMKIEPLAVKNMMNMTNDRLHKNGEKVLYPTFVNIGDQAILSGSQELFVIHFKALRNIKPMTTKVGGMLVSTSLDCKPFEIKK